MASHIPKPSPNSKRWASGPRVLIFIEDGTFILDHRVRREAATLLRAGARVSVLCPRYPGETRREDVEGVAVYRYRKPNLGSGILGHAFEYASSLGAGFLVSLWISFRHGLDVLQFCNPPDFLFPIAWLHRWLGKKILFDHHDLCPELYRSRFGGTSRTMERFLLWCERMTLRGAHHVLSTNESYRRIAIERAGLSSEGVTVVRNGPSLERFDRESIVPRERTPGRIRVGYVGNMNPQDGVHLLVEAARKLGERGREDVEFLCVGAGDSFPALRRSVEELGIADRVTFTGRVSDEEMLAALASCDLGIQPDPKNPLNDVSTMNKVMEYMALGLPVVAFDLVETRVSCGGAALYAEPNSIDDLVAKILVLADDEALRDEMGREGIGRIESKLAWCHSEESLLSGYERALAMDSADSNPESPLVRSHG